MATRARANLLSCPGASVQDDDDNGAPEVLSAQEQNYRTKPYLTFTLLGCTLLRLTRSTYDSLPLLLRRAADDCMVAQKND